MTAKKNPADTTAVQNQIADNKAAVQKSAEQTPAPQNAPEGQTPPAVVASPEAQEAQLEQMNKQAAEQPANEDKAAQVAEREKALEQREKDLEKKEKELEKKAEQGLIPPPTGNPLEEEMARVNLNEKLGALDREEASLKAHEEFFVDPNARLEAMLASQGDKDGKLTEPNFVTEGDHHNALSAIRTARLNEPDYTDAAQRGAKAVKELHRQQEERPTLVGEGVDRELSQEERDQVEILRSRGETRGVQDPKNVAPEDKFAKHGEEKTMATQRQEIEKAEKALEKEQAGIQADREKATKERETEVETQAANQKKLLQQERERQQGKRPKA